MLQRIAIYVLILAIEVWGFLIGLFTRDNDEEEGL